MAHDWPTCNLRTVIIEGNEGYRELARLTAWGYRFLLESDRTLRDGQGNCWLVAAIAHGVARALNLRPGLYGGQVFNTERNEPQYRSGGHYWTVVDGVIVDSPGADLLMIGTAAQRLGVRYVPLANARGGNASMRRARGLRTLSDSTCHRTLTDPPPAGMP
jgi:hypothetical protein